jgi:hypothetical protein
LPTRHATIVLLQADFAAVTGKPLALGLRRKVYVTMGTMLLGSAVLGVGLRFTSPQRCWWQHAVPVLCSCLVWLLSCLFVFTCAGLSATAKSVGDELTQVCDHAHSGELLTAFVLRHRTATTHKQNKPRGLSPPANYTDRATAACRRS